MDADQVMVSLQLRVWKDKTGPEASPAGHPVQQVGPPSVCESGYVRDALQVAQTGAWAGGGDDASQSVDGRYGPLG